MSIRDGITNYYAIAGFRGLFWLSVARLTKGHPLIEVEPNLYVRARTTDLGTYKDVLLGGEYDSDFGDPQVIVDAGANVGMASVFLARKYPKAQIIAVEAESSNFAILVRNLAPYRNVIALHAAIWSSDGTVTIGGDREDGYQIGQSGACVRSLAIPTLMRHHSISHIDVLKMDIEGAETEVLRSAPWLCSVRHLAIETHGLEAEAMLAKATLGWSRKKRRETNFLSSGR